MVKYVAVAGGLGNQMFQFAYSLFLKQRFPDVRLLLPSSSWEHDGGFELTRVFGIEHEPDAWERLYNKGKLFRKLFTIMHRTYLGKNFKVMPSDLYPSDGYGYFFGTWQSDQYFYDHALLRRCFRFREELLSDDTLKVAEALKWGGVKCSVHIRRGDYLSKQFSAGFGNCCPLEYYLSAMKYVMDKVPDVRFVFFSDDMAWVKENLPVDRGIYVDHNHGDASWQDMYLMSRCSHHIIANSTFSWWGAWLNPNEGKIVVAPRRWWSTIENDDVVPASWVRM